MSQWRRWSLRLLSRASRAFERAMHSSSSPLSSSPPPSPAEHAPAQQQSLHTKNAYAYILRFFKCFLSFFNTVRFRCPIRAVRLMLGPGPGGWTVVDVDSDSAVDSTVADSAVDSVELNSTTSSAELTWTNSATLATSVRSHSDAHSHSQSQSSWYS